MGVIIGVDPHKASHTAVAVDGGEDELGTKKVRATRNQVPQLLAWAESYPTRTWAVESAYGLGFLLAQQLLDAGETVVDVPATLVSRTRVLGSGRSNKNDANDALSVALTALRNHALRPVAPVDHRDVLRMLAHRWPSTSSNAETVRHTLVKRAVIVTGPAGLFVSPHAPDDAIGGGLPSH
jgi:transposase